MISTQNEPALKSLSWDPHFDYGIEGKLSGFLPKPELMARCNKIADDLRISSTTNGTTRDYMRAHTSYAVFLRISATGELLRSGKTPEIDLCHGEAADPADYLVWDTATNAAVPQTLPVFRRA